jgi:hypothetical protein
VAGGEAAGADAGGGDVTLGGGGGSGDDGEKDDVDDAGAGLGFSRRASNGAGLQEGGNEMEPQFSGPGTTVSS